MMRWKKLVVRNLPHDITCEEALNVCGFPVTYTESVLRTPIFPSVFFRWEAGRPAKNGRAILPSRLYLQFRKDPDLLEQTLSSLHGKEVSLANGSSLVLTVFVAPNQKLPREKRRRDNKMNTIARDPDFIAFLEDLNDEDKKQPPLNPNIIAPGSEVVDEKSKEKPMSALVKYLNERRVERREKGKFSRGNSSNFPTDRKKKDMKGKTKEKRKPKDVDGSTPRPPKENRGGKKTKEKRRSSAYMENGNVIAMPPIDHLQPMMLMTQPPLPPSMDMQPGMFRIMPKAMVDMHAPPLPPPPLPQDGAMRYEDDVNGRGGRGRGGGRGGRGKKDRREGEGGRGGNGGGRGGGKKKVGYVPKGQSQPPLPPTMVR